MASKLDPKILMTWLDDPKTPPYRFGLYSSLLGHCGKGAEHGDFLKKLIEILLDLGYEEDSRAEVDMNIVRTGAGRYVEIQGTAESSTFDDEELKRLLAAADKGIQELIALQKQTVGELKLLKPQEARPLGP